MNKRCSEILKCGGESVPQNDWKFLFLFKRIIFGQRFFVAEITALQTCTTSYASGTLRCVVHVAPGTPEGWHTSISSPYMYACLSYCNTLRASLHLLLLSSVKKKEQTSGVCPCYLCIVYICLLFYSPPKTPTLPRCTPPLCHYPRPRNEKAPRCESTVVG